MTNSRSTAKWAGERSCCGAATGVADRVVGIWRLMTVTLVLGLLAAAPVRALCINDGQGPDDQPGQKDVSGLCEPGPTCSSSSTTLSLLWQMDDVTWSGGNTGDACALIDLNQDGLADRAICVTTFGAAQMAGKCSNNQFLGCTKNQDCGSGGTCVLPTNNTGAPRCYTCANDRATRCTNSQPIACTSVCSVGVVVGADPFSSSATHTATKCNGTNCRTNDTAVNCCLTSADVGTGGELIDVCSYPSQRVRPTGLPQSRRPAVRRRVRATKWRTARAAARAVRPTASSRPRRSAVRQWVRATWRRTARAAARAVRPTASSRPRRSAGRQRVPATRRRTARAAVRAVRPTAFSRPRRSAARRRVPATWRRTARAAARAG